MAWCLRENDVKHVLMIYSETMKWRTNFLMEISFTMNGVVAYKKILRSTNKALIIDLTRCSESRSRWPCGLRRSSIAGTAGSNPVEDIDVSLLCLLCVGQVAASATGWSLVQGSRTVCVCVCVCVRARVCVCLWLRNFKWGRPRPDLVRYVTGKNIFKEN
jgi:hypothetical protein